MSSELTQFEKSVLEATILQHAALLVFSRSNLNDLKVVRREPTGVGAYIVLDREVQTPPTPGVSHQLGFTGKHEVPGVPSGLGAVVLVESGKLFHIEFFTYGKETWDGDTSRGTVVPESPLRSPQG